MSMRIDPPGMNYTEKELCAYLRRSCEVLNKIITEIKGELDKAYAFDKEATVKLTKMQESIDKLIVDSQSFEERCTALETRCTDIETDIRSIQAQLNS